MLAMDLGELQITYAEKYLSFLRRYTRLRTPSLRGPLFSPKTRIRKFVPYQLEDLIFVQMAPMVDTFGTT